MDWNKVTVCGLAKLYEVAGLEFVIKDGKIVGVDKNSRS